MHYVIATVIFFLNPLGTLLAKMCKLASTSWRNRNFEKEKIRNNQRVRAIDFSGIKSTLA